jgi:hypothetical protein
MLTVLSVAMLAAWWVVDVLIDKLEYRRGPTGSWLAGATFMALLCFNTPAILFMISAFVIALGLSYHVIYWFMIRRN